MLVRDFSALQSALDLWDSFDRSRAVGDINRLAVVGRFGHRFRHLYDSPYGVPFSLAGLGRQTPSYAANRHVQCRWRCIRPGTFRVEVNEEYFQIGKIYSVADIGLKSVHTGNYQQKTTVVGRGFFVDN